MALSLPAASKALHELADDINRYIAHGPRGHRFASPVIDWHHPEEYSQHSIQGLTKFLSQVIKERTIVDTLAASKNPPADYSTNLVALQGVWDAFKRATPPLIGIWQVMDRRPGPGGGGGAGATKVDVVAKGGNEWIKVNTIKESRLLIEFREHDSYINSDYDSDSDDDTGPPTPPLTNTLLTQARALVESVKSHGRLPNLPTPTIKYVLTRLEPTGHSDPRVSETLDMMRNMGIDIEFACDWHSTAPPTPPAAPDPIPAEDIVLDLSVLIALCCDSTHYPLPKDQDELERRFRAVQDDGSLARLTGASRDLRDQLRCEMQRPLILELRDRFAAARVTPRFWVTKEVRERLPNLVDVIGGQAERARARALFDPSSGNFWKGSRWEGKAGCLSDIRVRVLEDSGDGIVNGHAEPLAPSLRNPETPFDELAIHVCDVMLDSTNESPDPTPRSASPAIKEKPTPTPVKKPTRPPRPKRETQSRSPLRPGTVFPPASRLPSGHTLRTLVAGIGRRATVLTNNRGAVLKVLREAGVAEGIPVSSDHCGSDTPRARIWVVNPSSLAEWRRIEVEESNARRKEKGVASNGKENGVHEEETKESTQ